MTYKILFVEPPKNYWFLMGEYLPPPTVLLILAAYVERELPDVEIQVMDCQAERKSWMDVEERILSFSPAMVISSGFTCNAYACARTMGITKKVDKNITTVVGGQHFTATAEESLRSFPEIDYIVCGEGEVTLVELIKSLKEDKDVGKVAGLAFMHNGGFVKTPPRRLIENLDSLPYPAYHYVKDLVKEYHFTMMAGKNTRYMIMEGSRGCSYKCSFCSQWRHWNGTWRSKSAKRIANEMEHLHNEFGAGFLWYTDDNFNYRVRGKELWEELRNRHFTKGVSWFFQARTDDIANNPELVAKLQSVGNSWILVGVENNSPETLKSFKKGVRVNDAAKAVKVLNDNDVFSQCMYIVGSRKDTPESIENLRQFSISIDSQIAIYAILTPMPGTDVYDEAMQNGWIEDTNYAHYDMVHAIMPTESLTRQQVQEELFKCYRMFYGSITRGLSGIFSKNMIKRRAYRHMARKSVLRNLRRLL